MIAAAVPLQRIAIRPRAHSTRRADGGSVVRCDLAPLEPALSKQAVCEFGLSTDVGAELIALSHAAPARRLQPRPYLRDA